MRHILLLFLISILLCGCAAADGDKPIETIQSGSEAATSAATEPEPTIATEPA